MSGLAKSERLILPKAIVIMRPIRLIHFEKAMGVHKEFFCNAIAEKSGYHIDWTLVNQQAYIQASITGFVDGDYGAIESIFKQVISQIELRLNTQLMDIQLSAEIMQKVSVYVEKQLVLTEIINQKNQYIISNADLAKSFGQQAKQLSYELKTLANEIINDSLSAQFLKQPYLASLPKQGGFSIIHEKLKKSEAQSQDILAVLRYAQSSIRSISQSLNQEQGRSRHK